MGGVRANKAQFVGNIGKKRVGAILASWNIATNELKENDFGEDYICDIFSCINNVCVRTNQSFRVQVKTTPSFSKSYIRKTKKGYSISIKASLLNLWKSCFWPTILCVWCIEENKGFWCAPAEEFKNKDLLDTEQVTVHLFEDFESSEEKIKSYVSNFYNRMFNTTNARFSCNVYPIWMPNYRLFTVKELLDIDTVGKQNISSESPDSLPSFLTSYNTLNINSVAGVHICESKSELQEFLRYLHDKLIDMFSGVATEDTWISFIVSPIELICDNHSINTFTEWQSLSILDGVVIKDEEYAFKPTKDYRPTIPNRATSSDINFYIHKSDRFAIALYSETFRLLSRKENSALMNKLISNSYCAWDISKCTSEEKEALLVWCESNNLKLEETDIDNIVVISNLLLSVGDYGVLVPGALTWKEYDEKNLEQKLLLDIPVGRKASKNITKKIDRIYLDPNNTHYCSIDEKAFVDGEVLNLSKRQVVFIKYIRILNKTKLIKKINELKSKTHQQLDSIVEKFELYIKDDYTDGLADLIMTIQPRLKISSEKAIEKASSSFENTIALIEEYVDENKSMDYYIKYNLDRYIVEK